MKKAVKESNEAFERKLDVSSTLVPKDVAVIRKTVNDHLMQSNIALALEKERV